MCLVNITGVYPPLALGIFITIVSPDVAVVCVTVGTVTTAVVAGATTTVLDAGAGTTIYPEECDL
ncbi:MAG: hypothetical protein NTZ92_05020 [Candidatus Omnitrophica bacterium]|nr:hypothetical protein [Candidatus Omnitrophota bacterium]